MLLDGLRGECDPEREREHDRGVTEGEKEPDSERPLALLEEESRGVVDRRDVVGIEGVAEAEAVRERARSRVHAAEVVRVVEEESPAQDVEERDGAEEASQPERLPLGEAPMARPGALHHPCCHIHPPMETVQAQDRCKRRERQPVATWRRRTLC